MSVFGGIAAILIGAGAVFQGISEITNDDNDNDEDKDNSSGSGDDKK